MSWSVRTQYKVWLGLQALYWFKCIGMHLKSMPPESVVFLGGVEGAVVRWAGGEDRMTQAYYWAVHNKACLRMCARKKLKLQVYRG